MVKKIAKFNPCISTENMGDFIIEDYCNRIFDELFQDHLSIQIPTRERLSKLTRRKVATADYAFLCGTNMLSSNMRVWKQWNIALLDSFLIKYADVRKKDLFDFKKIVEKGKKMHVVLFGVGWFEYQSKPTWYTKKLLETLLDRNMLHSVRDSYTEKQLKSIGITNVINTGCPTMWELTSEVCAQIPQKKADIVVATLTNYRKNEEQDKILLQILLDNYKHVHVWLQAYEDYEYLGKIGFMNRIEMIPPTLSSYDKFLETYETDYVGTRLHGGIRALNAKRRACVIAVDNRAIEIAKDTGLPIIMREKVNVSLEKWITETSATEIKLPFENIQKWKSQFDK